ncbi:hypothetical protein ACWGJB_20880 [Streptomyces sp. NPDC054813]
MTTDNRRNERRGREPSPADADSIRPAAAPGPDRPPEENTLARRALGSPAAWARLLRLKRAEADTDLRRRRAHVDNLLRVIRNLAALMVFFSAVSTLVAYAGIRMGVSPEVCWIGTVGGGPVLVRTFIKLFETVRPSLPDAPADRPSSDEQ